MVYLSTYMMKSKSQQVITFIRNTWPPLDYSFLTCNNNFNQNWNGEDIGYQMRASLSHDLNLVHPRRIYKLHYGDHEVHGI